MENLKIELEKMSFVQSAINPFLTLQDRIDKDMEFFLKGIEKEKSILFEETNKKEQSYINEAIKQDLKAYFESILNSL